MEQYATYVGIFAGVCTCISLLPQLIKIIREKKAENISYLMLFILLTGVGTWIWYGTLKDDLPIIITNCVSFVINLLVIFFTMRYKKDEKEN
jgi:MtN3 and saliva related transmembrane protein